MCGIRCGKMGVGVQSSKYDHAGIVKKTMMTPLLMNQSMGVILRLGEY